MSAATDETPEAQCPRCGEWVPDFDGFGVLAHATDAEPVRWCCSHPTRDGDGKGNMVCGICGDVRAPRRSGGEG